jgi:hypothetical protein
LKVEPPVLERSGCDASRLAAMRSISAWIAGGIARLAPKPRGNDDRAFGQFGMAIGIVQRPRPAASPVRPIAQHHVAIDQDVLHLAP